MYNCWDIFWRHHRNTSPSFICRRDTGTRRVSSAGVSAGTTLGAHEGALVVEHLLKFRSVISWFNGILWWFNGNEWWFNGIFNGGLIGSNGNFNGIWLVVDLPLWKIWVCQLGLLFPIYGKIIQMFQNHQPAIEAPANHGCRSFIHLGSYHWGV